MSGQINLKQAEQKVFTTAYNDGLWDIFLGCFFLIFSIAPYLSPSLGDFWSSVVFIPFLGLVFLVVWLVRKYVVIPRAGVVKFGRVRKTKLARFSVLMLVINIAAFILGIIAALNFRRVPGQVISIVFGLQLLACLSMAAYFLDFKRLYVYGLLLGLSPLVGERLFQSGVASHHGFPLTFGISSGIMILSGLIAFIRLLRSSPVPLPPDER